MSQRTPNSADLACIAAAAVGKLLLDAGNAPDYVRPVVDRLRRNIIERLGRELVAVIGAAEEVIAGTIARRGLHLGNLVYLDRLEVGPHDVVAVDSENQSVTIPSGVVAAYEGVVNGHSAAQFGRGGLDRNSVAYSLKESGGVGL